MFERDPNATAVTFIGSIPYYNQAITWCWNNVGPQGTFWWVSFITSADTYKYVFTFKNESDAIMFKLRWV